MKPRDGSYVWATWLTGLLSGDDSCRWQLWAKAHHTYDKRHDDSFDLVKWKAEHGEMVRGIVTEMKANGYTVLVEGQTKFTIKGRVVTLAGQADVLALLPDGSALVVDAKTGSRKAKDVWQVIVYQVALPLAGKVAEGAKLHGQVRYRDGVVNVPPIDDVTRAKVLAILAEAGSSIEPPRTPSAGDCRFCDIAACPDRVTEPTPEVVTGAF